MSLPNGYHIYKVDKECKHSRRYTALDANAPIKSVYVSRSYADGAIHGVDEITVTIREVKKE